MTASNNMNVDPVLLNVACGWAIKAYKDQNKDAEKIESKLTSTTAFFVRRKTIDIIAFRGTAEGQDALTDAFVVPLPWAGRLCHGGFRIAIKSIWKEIEEKLDYKKRTLFCGHSLGGALAELAAAKVHKKHSNLNLVTFGKPNTFFKGFKRPLQLDNQVSVVHGSDIVARIPRLLYGASCSQDQLYFANNGACRINPDKDFKKSDFLSEKDEMLSDHFMKGYRKSLDVFLTDWEKSKKKEGLKGA